MDANDEAGQKVASSCQPAELRVEKCLFGKQEIELPELLLEDGLMFSEVISQKMWQSCLTEENQSALLKLLPQFPENDVTEKQKTLEMLFSGKNFKFGSPLKQFHKKLKDGRYLPDIARYASLCRKAKQQEYQYQQEVYYESLLCEILLNRQRILEELYRSPPEEPVKFDHIYWSHNPSKQKNQNLNYRVNQKCHQLIREVNQECGQAETSSDEEEDSFASSVTFSSSNRSLQQQPQPKQAAKMQVVALDSPDCSRTSVLETFAPRPVVQTPVASGSASPVIRKWQQPGKHPLLDVTGEDYQEMMRKYKRRKTESPDHPELDTTGITLEDVISRTQLSKKVKATTAVHCKKKWKKSEMNKKPAGVKPGEMDSLPSSDLLGNATLNQAAPSPNVECVQQMDRLDVGDLLCIKKEESDEEVDVQDCSFTRVTGSRQNFGRYANFFSLLKEFICEDQEEKIVTSKLEEKVREWQESDSAAESNSWFKDHSNWVDLVSSALKFLSGDILGLSLENFIPLLDYKERAQQWRWIGQGRDSDDDLANLFAHWAEHRDTEQLDSGSDKMAPVPPPKMWTEYVVRPSTEEERLQFQVQEKERFSNPHRAYTYRMHGYESVVGPVKGVYAKESAIIKAREHALLVKDRPSYVTILTLVHDGAARLPNGEGTRNDICELLKDSQFLAPGVTESQINTVVSGALDRLHYEKDPCVKYDGTRKLWIYRHRNRTEEEFEKIHQAQAAAAKAKKMALPKKSKVVKPSNAKKLKEPASSAAQRLLETLMVQSSTLSSTSTSIVLPPASVAYSSSSLGTSASLTSTALSSDIAGGFLSSSSNLGSSSGQKGLALPMSTVGASSVPSSVSKTATFDSDAASVSLPTKTTSVDVRLHQVSSVGKPFTISLVQQHKPVVMTTLPSNIQHRLFSGSKPVTFNLIQSHLASGKAASVSGGISSTTTTASSSSSSPLPSFSSSSPSDNVWPQSKAILFPPSSAQADGSKPKIVALQHLSKTVQLPSAPSQLQQQIKALQQQQQQQQQQQPTTGASSHAPVALLQTSSRLASTSSVTKPLVTGLIQQQSHLSNVIHLSVGQTAVTGKSGIGVPCSGKPAFTATSAIFEVKDDFTMTSANKSLPSASGTPIISGVSPAAPVMKPELPVSIATTSSSILTQQLAAQILKPVGGKPVFIGGKPATILTPGKPFSIGGKQMLISRSGSTQVGQLVETVSGPSSASCVTSGVSQPSVAMTTIPKSTVSSSLVSQILQPGTLLSQQSLFRGGLVRVSGNGQVIISGQQPVRTGTQGQVRVASPAPGQMRLMSIPTGTLGQTARIIVPDQSGLIMATSLAPQSVPDLNAERKANIVTSFANIVGTQMFLQQPTNLSVQQQQQASQSGSLHSALIAQNAKSEQNIQLIKSLISSTPVTASKQPQQTAAAAILLANPTSQSLSLAVEQGEKSVPALAASSARMKSGPVFARIINPPGNIRVSNPGQMLAQGQLTAMQGLVQVSGSHLSLDASQIQQLVAAQKQNPDASDKLDTTLSTKTESR